MTQYQPSLDLQMPIGPERKPTETAAAATTAAANNPFIHAAVPTFADVLERIRTDPALSPSRCADLSSALRTTARLLGQDVVVMPAMPGLYRVRVSKLTPIGTGLSAKRLANLRSDVLFALRRYGLVRTRRNALPAISEAWLSVWQHLTVYQRWQLSRFVKWCSSLGIAPSAASDDVISRFLHEIEQESFVGSVPAGVGKSGGLGVGHRIWRLGWCCDTPHLD